MILKAANVTLGKTYPEPLIGLKEGRERALEAYQDMKRLPVDPDSPYWSIYCLALFPEGFLIDKVMHRAFNTLKAMIGARAKPARYQSNRNHSVF